MKRFLAAAVLLCLAATGAQSYWQSRSQVSVSGAAPAYTGPCDLITCTAAYGLRAPSAATRGLKLVNVCNSTGGVDVGCADMLSDATTGQLVSATVSGITCPGANCTVKIYYDILAANNCSAASCDVTQATVASRHTLGTSCAPLTVSVCATSTGGFYISANTMAMTAAPVFFSAVTNVAASTSQQVFIGDNGGLHTLYSWNVGGAGRNAITCDGLTTNQASSIVGTGGYFATAGLCNGASSYVAVGSSVNATVTLAFNSATQLVAYGGQTGNAIQTGGIIQEGQIGNGSNVASATATTLTANAKSFYGWP